MKLFLKGNRCFTEKCAIEKRNFAPGQHGKRRVKMQGYGVQLREKQKVKRIYGLLENQFRLAFQDANRKKGVTGELLLVNLERRLDTIAYRLGFAASRAQARQLIAHGHVRVDGRKVDIPSYPVKPGQVISLKEKMGKNTSVQAVVRPGRAQGHGREPAPPRGDHAADPGAADRRVVQQVRNDGSPPATGIHKEDRGDAVERLSEAEAP